jgi:hypothetical protein
MKIYADAECDGSGILDVADSAKLSAASLAEWSV